MAAARCTAPMPNRLALAPKVSATQPKLIRPSIAQAMTLELNTPKTRAMRFLGVRSCSEADTMGTKPELAPITTINPAVMTREMPDGSRKTAAPPESAAVTKVQSLRQSPSCFL